MKVRLFLTLLVLFVAWMIWEQDTGRLNSIAMFVKTIPMGDKMAHFAVMGTIALLANMSLNYRTTTISKLALPTGTLIVLVLATLEEFSQIAFPTRTFDLLDLSMNYLGIGVFTWFGWQYNQQMPRQNEA